MNPKKKAAEHARIAAYLAAREAEDRAAGTWKVQARAAATSLCVHGHPLGRGHECPGCLELARQYANRSSHARAIERASADPMATA